MIQHNSVLSAQLADAIDNFLNRGGVIATLQGFVHKPKPPAKAYGRIDDDLKPKVPRRKQVESKPCDNTTALSEAEQKARTEIEDSVRLLAKTMTLAETIRETGMSNTRLRNMAKACGFQFKRYDPTPSLKPNSVNRVADAMNVVRIKAARDRGLSRKDACAELRMSSSLMKRLLSEYSIDFPLHPPGRK
ncbi:hypothetical protein PS3A_03430 [Pseudomonas sp. 3A(2025)]